MTTLRPVSVILDEERRGSDSSSRSRRTEADFEAALNQADTIFLKAGPSLDVDQSIARIGEIDENAPEPIEKRSFDQDYKLETTPRLVRASIIPPTPSSGPASVSNHQRRDSKATITSTDSGGARAKYKTLKAIGLDEEVAMEDAASSKKRSIFRSPGTASSPDLATLVRRAKEAKGAKSSPARNVQNGLTQSQSSASGLTRERSVSQVTIPEEGRSLASMSTDRMNTIAESSSRRRQSPESSIKTSGSKSIRNRARGVLGRMFGGSTQSPPVPPVPPSYTEEAERRRASDVFGTLQSPARSSPKTELRQSPSQTSQPSIARRGSSPLHGRQSSEIPTQSILGRRGSDKPLPVIQPNLEVEEEEETLHSASSGQETIRKSRHTRQPAFADDGQPSPGKVALATFSDDVADMFDGIGDSHPAHELGLPPDSLRLKDKKPSFASRERMMSDFGTPTSIYTDTKVSVPSRSTSLPRLAPPITPQTPPPSQAPALSRTSSTSSRRSNHVTDFGPVDGSKDATIRAKPPLESPYVGSIRLVPSRQTTQNEIPTWSHSDNPEETPQEEDHEEKGRRLACEFLENDESTLASDRVAEFIGGPRPVNQIALKYYMQYFDMKGQTLVDSFRDLCKKLHLKAESQEIDRIIEAFSKRYFECNPNTVFGTPGVVHTITGAMLMLNTDLHIADLSKHMTRTDFVRNAMRAIQESTDGASTPDLIKDDSRFGSNSSMTTSASVTGRPKDPPLAQRSASAPVMLSENAKNSVGSFSKAWELETETALKDIYAAVRSDKILLPMGDLSPITNAKRQSVLSIGDLNRNKTIRSPSGGRVSALKRGSVFGAQSLSNQSLGVDGRLSPTPSFATSMNDNFGYTPTIGFASNLSQAVIKEHEDETRSMNSETSIETQDEMDDDELALLGAPWAKEGLLQRKIYYESLGKRAKKNDWKQLFVVIQKGELMMFVFGQGSGSLGGSVGGGNWTKTNANTIGTISLMHTMAVALPKPGYNASRPYCFSLASPSGETSFFQAGTEDLVTEWVQTCNYWAARTSRQPLQGGVSNMEYGWNRVNPSNGDDEDRASIKSSRSSLSKFTAGTTRTYGRRNSGVPADKIFVNDWKPPPPAGMPSPLDEESQLEALSGYVKSLMEELELHKSVEEPMMKIFTPGSKNAAKARDNWKAKSQYIHTEIFKYEIYLDALRNAISQRVKKQGERRLEKSLKESVGTLERTPKR